LENLEEGSSAGDFERWIKGALGMEFLSLKRLWEGGLGGRAPSLETLCRKCGTAEETSLHICCDCEALAFLNHTYQTIDYKKADDVSQRIEDALNLIVNLTDKSGNMKKELKKSVHEAVSNFRNLIFALKSNLQEKTEENNRMQSEVNLLKDALQKWESTSTTRQVAPSVTSRPGLTSRGTADAAPLIGEKKKQLSKVLSGKTEEGHKLTVKSKENQSTEQTKKLLKTKIHSALLELRHSNTRFYAASMYFDITKEIERELDKIEEILVY